MDPLAAHVRATLEVCGGEHAEWDAWAWRSPVDRGRAKKLLPKVRAFTEAVQIELGFSDADLVDCTGLARHPRYLRARAREEAVMAAVYIGRGYNVLHAARRALRRVTGPAPQATDERSQSGS